MARAVRFLRPAEAQLNELIAHVDKGVMLILSTQGELEDFPVKIQRLIEIVDFQHDVIDAERPSLSFSGIGVS